MKPFSLNYDSKWELLPYSILSSTAQNPTSSHEITVDTDFKTISKIISESLIEIVKKNFEATSKAFSESKILSSSQQEVSLDTE